MTRSVKSTVLLSNAIAWSGVILASLILTYGASGPARHPKMLLVAIMPVAGVSIATLLSKRASRASVVTHCILWGAAVVATFALTNTSLGDGVPPIASTAGLFLLAVISSVTVFNTRFRDPSPEQL